MKPKFKIDIVSDIVCPWCYIGKRRLEKALEKLANAYDFEIEYHPFELNPQMPKTGAKNTEYLINKFGGVERFEQITQHVTEVAAAEGLNFDFKSQKVSPNTRKAHSLVQIAKSEEKQLELIEAFFKAYFTEGVDLSNDKNLIDIAVRAGLDRAKIEAYLQDENIELQVALAEQEMYKLGISGVPFYIINNRYGISGAQASETFIKALQEVAGDITPAGESCDVEAKNC